VSHDVAINSSRAVYIIVNGRLCRYITPTTKIRRFTENKSYLSSFIVF